MGWSITLTITTSTLLRDFCLIPSIAITVIVLSAFSFNFNKSTIDLVQTDTSAPISITSWHSI